MLNDNWIESPIGGAALQSPLTRARRRAQTTPTFR